MGIRGKELVQYRGVAEVAGMARPGPFPTFEGWSLQLPRPAGAALRIASAVSQCRPNPTHPRLRPWACFGSPP